mmetsp:Transcript_62854/g.118204  ORF Transcript_62854/g.118204 Transcript_62854/m.118204 type:complete len:321 (+) Transcript_62854:55-1017(+)
MKIPHFGILRLQHSNSNSFTTLASASRKETVVVVVTWRRQTFRTFSSQGLHQRTTLFAHLHNFLRAAWSFPSLVKAEGSHSLRFALSVGLLVLLPDVVLSLRLAHGQPRLVKLEVGFRVVVVQRVRVLHVAHEHRRVGGLQHAEHGLRDAVPDDGAAQHGRRHRVVDPLHQLGVPVHRQGPACPRHQGYHPGPQQQHQLHQGALLRQQQPFGREDTQHVRARVQVAVAVDPHHHVAVEVEDFEALLDAAHAAHHAPHHARQQVAPRLVQVPLQLVQDVGRGLDDGDEEGPERNGTQTGGAGPPERVPRRVPLRVVAVEPP